MARSTTSAVVLGMLTLAVAMMAYAQSSSTEDSPNAAIAYVYTDTHLRGERIALSPCSKCCPIKNSKGENVGVRSASYLQSPRR